MCHRRQGTRPPGAGGVQADPAGGPFWPVASHRGSAVPPARNRSSGTDSRVSLRSFSPHSATSNCRCVNASTRRRSRFLSVACATFSLNDRSPKIMPLVQICRQTSTVNHRCHGTWDRSSGSTTVKNGKRWKSLSRVQIRLTPCSRINTAVCRSCITLPRRSDSSDNVCSRTAA